MEFFRIARDIPFMRHALVFNVISLITFVAAVVLPRDLRLNLGVDFRGGTVIEVHVRARRSISRGSETRSTSSASANLARRASAASETALIRLPLKEGLSSAQLSDRVMGALKADDATASQRRVEFVGPQVGKELYDNGALALLLVSIGIVIYLALRFEWRFAVAAIVANLHDVIIILGFFAVLPWEFSLPVLAAVLAVLGYSVNESVVIADRIRENFRKMRKASVTHVIDSAITRTLSRTIITHGCTLLMVLSIFFFGGETLHHFSLALAIGICFGIYSSALVMASLVMWLGVSREDLVKPDRRRGALAGEKILP